MKGGGADQIETMRREKRVEEAGWLGVIILRLQQGPASTRELADACAIPPGRHFSRFRWTIDRSDIIVRAGETTGPTGHLNIVWALK